MAKRKRHVLEEDTRPVAGQSTAPTKKVDNDYIAERGLKKRALDVAKGEVRMASRTIQIIVGTYEKVLHGVIARISEPPGENSEQLPKVEFEDTFLFNAHTSAIRCLALSPSSKSSRIILATGSSDQTVNLYHISTTPPITQKSKANPLSLWSGKKVSENPKNQEIGSLQHHAGNINALYFLSRSKLLSAAEDNTVAVTRTRDWTVLSTIKAPIPKAQGRPSGDTAPFGGTPAGVNDFAVHPSMKLMVTVGKGEKCMRLWNLVTGKKAAVLNFGRELLQSVGEGERGRGEGHRIEWNGVGEEFVVAFERGCVIYGLNSKPKCRILPAPTVKIHQLHYLTLPGNEEEKDELLAVSTESGQILFYSTSQTISGVTNGSDAGSEIPQCDAIAQLGGFSEGLIGRIKDFEMLKLPGGDDLLIITGCSDGAVRLWSVDKRDLAGRQESGNGVGDMHEEVEELRKKALPIQIGRLLATYEAGNRITCLKAFVMSDTPEIEDGEVLHDTLTKDADVDDNPRSPS